jgi:hypothetical protein
MQQATTTKHLKEVEKRNFFKHVAISVCAVASGIAWLAIIGLTVLFRDLLPI